MNKRFFSFLKALGFVELIKIPNKGFDDLTPYEISLMIDAFVYDEDRYFDPMALGDFLHYSLCNENVYKIREDIKNGIFKSGSSEGFPEYDFEFLKAMSEQLKNIA